MLAAFKTDSSSQHQEKPNIPKEDATQELDNGFSCKNLVVSSANVGFPLLVDERRKDRIVLNNWSNPLKRFLEEQKNM